MPSDSRLLNRFGDGAEVDDVLGQHDREHDDRDDRDDASADRDDVAAPALGAWLRAAARPAATRPSVTQALATVPRASVRCTIQSQ